MWNDFDKVYKVVDGKNIRFQAVCKHCKAIYSSLSSNGTGHVQRHREKCEVRNAKSCESRMSQTMIQFNPDGSVRHWEYNVEVAHTQLCRLIARLELPIYLGETDAFEEYIKIAHNTMSNSMSRQITRDLVKYYGDCHAKLVEALGSGVSSVALTSNIWSENAKEDCLSVVAHFVNSDW